jgi:signal transduction histidine kinase
MTTLTQSQSIETPAHPFNRVSWLVVTLALGLVLVSMVQKAYRLTLPADGWAFETGEIGSPDQDRPTYTHNLLDRLSPLQAGDRLLAVENQPFETIYARAHATQMQAMPAWQAGNTVRYTVERDGQPVNLDVPLYRWPGRVIARILLTDPYLWTGLLLAGVGFFVFVKRPEEWATYPLLLFSICLLARNISIAVVDWGLPELLTPAIFPAALFFSNWIFAVVMFPSLLLLTLLFPRPKQFVRQHPRPVLALLYGPVPLLILIFGSVAPIGWIWVLTMALLSLAALAHSFVTVRDPVGRAQMRWAASGLAVMALGFIPINLSGLGWLPVPFPLWLEDIWFPMMLIIMALGFSVAILRYRLFDIDILINRALVYGTLTILVISLYVLVVGYLGALFRTETNLYISLVATGLVAVLFQPARDWLQRGANRLMFGRRDDPVGMLTHLAQRLEAVDAPQAILPTLVETIAVALKLPYVALNTDQADSQPATIAAYGRPVGQLKSVPLLYQQQAIGHLLIAPRSPGERLSQADERLLATIAPLTATTLRAVQLSDALQASRREIVTGREEERRRLRRDLHDGLGPVLASVALQADTARELVDTDPVETKQLLAGIMTEAQTAVDNIRRLVYGLRPPALDELGLVKALRQTTGRHPMQVMIEAPDPLPSLPAAVEVAAYRIAQEAINNAIRHGQANHCTVALQADESLYLTITDNGLGLPPNASSGVGLISMQERVAELGGTFSIQPGPAGGTQIKVRLPLD